MARNDVYLNINALSPADAVVTGQQDMTAATVPELVLGDTPTFNFYFTDNTNVWPSWAGNASYSLTWALSDAVAGDFSPAATTGNATPITGGWSVILPLNSYDLVGLLNTKRVGQPYPVTNLWQQLRVTDPSGNEVTRAMFWTPVRYRAISDTQNTESASPTGGRFVTVNNVNTLTTPTAAQFYAANPVPTSALGTAANGELLIGNGTGFTKATITAGSGVSITNGSGSITISATDGDITLDDGTAAAPSLKFTSDTDTGLYRPAANTLGVAVGGAQVAYFDANGITTVGAGATFDGSVHAANGNANNPSISFTSDDNTGLFRHQPDEIGITLGGTQKATLTSTTFSITPNLSTSGNLTVSGTALLGTSDANTGSYFDYNVGIPGAAALWMKQTTKNAASAILAGGGSYTLVNGPSGGSLYLRIGNVDGITLDSSRNTTLAGNLTVSGATRVSDGTAAAPSIAPSSATTTGFYKYNASALGFSSSGSHSFLFGTDGTIYGANLGTTLSMPAAGGAILTAGGTNQSITLTPSGTGATVISKSETNTNAITTALNYIKIQNTSLGGTYIGALEFYTWDNRRAAGIFANRNNVDGTSGVLSFAYSTSGNSFAEGFRLNSTGNLLIGTTTDGGQKLQVSGTGYVSGRLTTNTGTLVTGGESISTGAGQPIGVQLRYGSVADTAELLAFDWANNGAKNLTLRGTTVTLQTGTYGGTTALTLDSSQNATFAGSAQSNANGSQFVSYNSNGSADQKYWSFQAGAAVGDGVFRLRALNDAGTNGKNAIVVKRTGISSVIVNLPSLPTSSAGLAAGDLWNDSGTVKVV